MTGDMFERTRALFDLPEGVIYLDGNSLGALSKAARERVAREIDANWGGQLIKSWTTAGWIDLPTKVGDKIGRLIGAAPGSVIVADSTSINLFKALMAALGMAGGRRTILSDTGNFPNDLYIAQGVIKALDRGHALKLVEPGAVVEALDETIAVLMLTEVDYRTGRLHDMAALTARAKQLGIGTIWDLAHSAGALPVDVTGAGADFAIGCGYKYLNGGPGAPAYIYVRPELRAGIEPVLSGWLGHAAPFDFDLDYRPAPTVERFQAGTPPVLSLAALDAALEVWEWVAIEDVRARSIILAEEFIRLVETRCPMLELASPRDPAERGSQVSFRHPEGYAIMRALIARGVIGDFRAPDIIRFGFTPLYVSPADVAGAAEHLAIVMRDRLWDNPTFKARAKVT